MKNKFIRFKDKKWSKKWSRLSKILGKLKNYYPCEDSENFKNYPYKYKNINNCYLLSDSDFWCECELDVFVRRYFKKWLNENSEKNVFIFSKFDGYKYDCRQNSLIFVTNLKFEQNMTTKYLSIEGFDINRKCVTLTFDLFRLNDIVVRPLSSSELKSFWSIFTSYPEPCYNCMEILNEYKDDFNKYIEDCKKYKFKPLDKWCIENANIKDYEMYVDKNGKFCYANSDWKIVNKNN